MRSIGGAPSLVACLGLASLVKPPVVMIMPLSAPALHRTPKVPNNTLARNISVVALALKYDGEANQPSKSDDSIPINSTIA